MHGGPVRERGGEIEGKRKREGEREWEGERGREEERGEESERVNLDVLIIKLNKWISAEDKPKLGYQKIAQQNKKQYE